MKKIKSVFVLALLLVAVGAMGQTYMAHQPGSQEYSYQDISKTPGKIFWVGNAVTGATDSSGYGKSPTKPFTTLDYAIGKCTASAGDHIYVLPGHVEDGLTANEFYADIAGITITGIGSGTLRPRFRFGDTDTTVRVGAANVTIENLTFQPKISAVVAGLIVGSTASNFTLRNCEFMVGYVSGTDEFVDALVLIGGANDVTIDHNIFRTASNDAQATGAIYLGLGAASVRTSITDNYISGAYSAAGIEDGTTASTDLLIAGNIIKVANGAAGISVVSGCTGRLYYNKITSLTLATPDTAIVAAGMGWLNNYVATTAGSQGELVGTQVEYTQPIGSEFYITKTVTNATAFVTAGAAMTGASSGTLMVMAVSVQNGLTAIDSSGHGGSITLYTTNAYGTLPFFVEADVVAVGAVLGCPGIATTGGTPTCALGTILESGKIIKTGALAENMTSAGTATVNILLKRLTAGATVSAI